MIPEAAVRPLLTVEEARHALGDVIGRSAFYEAIKRGDIPSVRVGSRRVFVPTAALRAWLSLDDDDTSHLDGHTNTSREALA